jgi:glycosyltransferase involved in cell wall biosynthesis
MILNLPDVVIFCPLPPKPNGIADYLAEQLPYFSNKIDVCVVIDNMAPSPIGVSTAITVLRLAEYLTIEDQLSHTPHLYHVGNNPDTKYMLPVLLNRPGIVMVHDLNLHYLIDLTNLSQGDVAAYTLALFNQYGVAGKMIGEQLQKYQWKGSHMPHELLMSGSVTDAASSIVVHSRYSANRIGATGVGNISIIPHHLSPEIRHHQPKLKMTYRGELGLPGNKVVITSMGFIAKAKQIRAVLDSLKVLKEEGSDFIYVLAGQCKQHEYDVYQDIADCGLQDNVLVTGFLSSEQFFKFLIASDFIVNLRYPTGGESSGTLTRAFGLGIGCIVVNIGPFAEIPDNCALKLNYDNDFSKNLQLALRNMIDDPSMRVEMGLNARRWVEETHNIDTTTAAYMALIAEEKERLANIKSLGKISNFEMIDYLPHDQILKFSQEHSKQLSEFTCACSHWWTQSLLPVFDSNQLFYVSENNDALNLAESIFDYELKTTKIVSAKNISNGEYTTDSTDCDRFLCILDVRRIQVDPVAAFSAINSYLTMGAVGCVSIIWDTSVDSELPLNRLAMLTYLEAAGFSVDSYHTGQADVVMMENSVCESHLQEWCFALTKRSRMVNMTPQPYYASAYSTLKLIVKEANNKGAGREI